MDTNIPHNRNRLIRIKEFKNKLKEVLAKRGVDVEKLEKEQLEKIKQAKTGQPIELTGYAIYDRDGNDTGKRFINKEDAIEYTKALREDEEMAERKKKHEEETERLNKWSRENPQPLIDWLIDAEQIEDDEGEIVK